MTTSPTFRNLPSGKQERILDEALSEFADKGYARASLNALVGRLGISKSSIFQYFHDKSWLFSQVFDFAVGRVKAHLRQVRESTHGQDVFQRLELSMLAGLDRDLAAMVVDAVLERFLIASSLEHLEPELELYGASPEQIKVRAAELVELLRLGLGGAEGLAG